MVNYNLFVKLIDALFILTDFNPKLLSLKDAFIAFNYKKSFNKFISHKVVSNTILITEPTESHGEVLPGVIKYCLDLGFNVEVLITNDKEIEKPLNMFNNLKVFSLSLDLYNNAIQSEFLNKYKFVIFTSSRVYYDFLKYGERFLTDYLPGIKISSKKIIFVEHHLDLLNTQLLGKYKFFALPLFSENYGCKMLNPHYFGMRKMHNKNKITNFVSVGNIDSKRRNTDLLIESVLDLHNKGYNNFKITVIGYGQLSSVPTEIRHYFNITGRLSYMDMYRELKKADFIIPLLDRTNKDHDRYLKYGASGSFQLMYGFLLIGILQNDFAKTHGYNNENCICYEKNEDLVDSMIKAINMSKKDYKTMKHKLSLLANKIYETSKNNLNMVLNGEMNE